MIPIRDVVPARATPWVTLTLIAINGLVLAAQFLAPGTTLRLATGDAPASLLLMPFVQLGWVQTVANAWALWLFGENVEDRLGAARFATAYLVGAAVALVAEVTLNPGTSLPVTGAAGAVAGILAGHLALFRGGRVLALAAAPIRLDLIDLPAIAPMALWLLFQMLAGTGVFSVLGGFATGGAAVWLLARADRMRVEWWGP